MRITTPLCSLLLATAALAAPSVGQARVDFFVNVAPPPPRVEVVPPPRPGYVWAPGYWRWHGHRYVWVRGYWLHGRHGRHWVPAHWVQNGPRWHYVPGYWAR